MPDPPESSDARPDEDAPGRGMPRPARPAPPPSVRSGGPVPAAEDGGDDGGSRPTPVREAMEAEREERQPVATPTVRFRRGEEDWIARVEGRSTAGFRRDGGAPLLFLTFAREEDPEKRLLETVAVGRAVDELGPGELGALLHGARPFRGAWEGDELFPETRKNRPSRR